MNNFEIRDETGVIHSGLEAEMRRTWDLMIMDQKAFIEEYRITLSQYKEWESEFDTDWEGDIELLEVHAIHR